MSMHRVLWTKLFPCIKLLNLDGQVYLFPTDLYHLSPITLATTRHMIYLNSMSSNEVFFFQKDHQIYYCFQGDGLHSMSLSFVHLQCSANTRDPLKTPKLTESVKSSWTLADPATDAHDSRILWGWLVCMLPSASRSITINTMLHYMCCLQFTLLFSQSVPICCCFNCLTLAAKCQSCQKNAAYLLMKTIDKVQLAEMERRVAAERGWEAGREQRLVLVVKGVRTERDPLFKGYATALI